MTEVAQAFVTLLPSARGFGRRLESEVSGDVSGAGKRLGSGFGKMFAVAGGALAAAGVGSFLKDAVAGAGELEQSVGAIETIFGKSSSKMLSWSKDAAQSVGLTQNEFNELGTLIGSQLKNGGTAMDQLAPKTQNLVTMGADLSAMFGGTTKDAVGALSSALKGERDPIERYGVSLNEAKIKAEAASLGFTAVGGALSDEAKQAATLALITKQTADAHGTFAKESSTLAGQQQRLSASWGNMKTQLGTSLLPAITAVVTGLNAGLGPAIGGIKTAFGAAKGYLSPFIADLRDRLAPALQRGMVMFREVAAQVQASLVPAFAQLRAGASAALPILLDLGTRAAAVIVPVLKQLGSALTTMLPPVVALAQTVGAALMPVLQRAGEVVVGTILPALASLSSFVLSSVVPVFTQVVGIIRTHVVPILAALATFVVGTLVPAVVGIVTAVGQRLKPVFDQLVVTFRAQVLPAVTQLLVKFREWQPTMQKVVMIVVKVVGAVLTLAAAILGKVLPPVIKFAGWLLSKLVPAVASVIGVLSRVIAGYIAFGAAVIAGGRKVAEFASKVIRVVTEIPGKVKSAFSGAASWLSSAGSDIVRGLGAGIESMYAWVKGKVDALAGWIPGWVKKKLGIASPSKVMAALGIWIPRGLAKGIEKGTPAAIKAAKALAQKTIDGVKSQIDAFKSLRDAIKSAYAPDLFSATPAMFGAGLKGQLGINNTILGALKKLKGMKLDPSFLSGLIQSGNFDLITALAGASKSTVRQQQKDWLAVQSTAGQIGVRTAESVTGERLADLRDELKQLNKAVRLLAKETGKEVGKAVNQSASNARRNRR